MKAIILGDGWVANARHKPALDKLSISYDTYDIRTDDDFCNSGYDFAVVSVPPMSRLHAVKKCLEKGIVRLYLEKPLAHTIEDAKEIIKLIGDYNADAYCLHNFAFSEVGKYLLSLDRKDIKFSIFTQVNREDRKLPKWIDELPFGIGLDEFPHFGYLSRTLYVDKGLNSDDVIFIEDDKTFNNKWEIAISHQQGWTVCNLWTDSYYTDEAVGQTPYWQYKEVLKRCLYELRSLVKVSINRVILKKSNDFGTNTMWEKLLTNTLSQKEKEVVSLDMGLKILQDYYKVRAK